jgi:hypothetical protein
MDKGKWIFAAVILGVVIVGCIAAAVAQAKVPFIKKITT